MFRRISRQERERRAARAELETTLQALRSNERAFTEAQDPFYIDQLTYQHAALMCRCRATGTMRRIEALQQALAHRPIHPGSDAHKVFRQRLRGEIQALSETYPELDFSEELNCSAHF